MIYLEYEESSSGGEICAGQEHYEWPSYEDEIITFRPTKLRRTEPYRRSSLCWESLDIEAKKGDIFYLVIPRYYDGGSFGGTSGYWQIHSVVKTREEAESIKKALKDENELYRKSRRDSSIQLDYGIDAKDKDKVKEQNITWLPYRKWYGYFAGLEDIEIHILDVE